MSARVLLVDDDPDVIRLLRRTFRDDDYQLEVAATAADALAAVGKLEPDLIVLDVGLPDVDGRDVAQELRAKGVHAPILMLTARQSERDVVAGLDSGATAYVTKPVRPSEVRAWTRALLRAPARTTAPLRTFGQIELDPERRRLRRLTTGAAVRLTPLQVQIIATMMEGGGQPLSKTELLRRVWQVAFDPGTAVVEVSILELRRKLARLGDLPRIDTIHGRGYALRAASA